MKTEQDWQLIHFFLVVSFCSWGYWSYMRWLGSLSLEHLGAAKCAEDAPTHTMREASYICGMRFREGRFLLQLLLSKLEAQQGWVKLWHRIPKSYFRIEFWVMFFWTTTPTWLVSVHLKTCFAFKPWDKWLHLCHLGGSSSRDTCDFWSLSGGCN